jgi:hypothetical protein
MGRQAQEKNHAYRKGEQSRCGFMTGDEEGDEIVRDGIIGKAKSRLSILGGEHQPEQVLHIARVFLPLPDDCAQREGSGK